MHTDLIFIIITLPPLLGGLGLRAARPCFRCSARLGRAAVHLYIKNMPDAQFAEIYGS